MKAPGYSIGPVSSEYFPDLVKNAIPADEGEIRVFGEAYWGDFQTSWPNKVPFFVGYNFYFLGVAALTDTNIILLLFNEDEQRYEIMTQVPYRFISFVSRLFLYFEKLGGFWFGENYYWPAYGRTFFHFRKTTGTQSATEKKARASVI